MQAGYLFSILALICSALLAFICLRKKKVKDHLPLTVRVEARDLAVDAAIAAPAEQPGPSVANASNSSRRNTDQSNGYGGGNSAARASVQVPKLDVSNSGTNSIRLARSAKSPYEIVDEETKPSSDELDAHRSRADNGRNGKHAEAASDISGKEKHHDLQQNESSRNRSRSDQPPKSAAQASMNEHSIPVASRNQKTHNNADRARRAMSTYQGGTPLPPPPPLPDRNYRPESLLDELNNLPEHEYAVIASTTTTTSFNNTTNASRSTNANRVFIDVESASSTLQDGSYERIGAVAQSRGPNESLPPLVDGDLAAQHGVVFAQRSSQPDGAARQMATYVGITVRESIASLRERNALPPNASSPRPSRSLIDSAARQRTADSIQAVYSGSLGSEYAQLSEVMQHSESSDTAAEAPSSAAASPVISNSQLVEVAPGYFSAVNKPKKQVLAASASNRAQNASGSSHVNTQSNSPYEEIDHRSTLSPHNRTAAKMRTAAEEEDDPYANASDVELESLATATGEDSASAGYARIPNFVVASTYAAGQARRRSAHPSTDRSRVGSVIEDADAVGYETIEAMQALRSDSGSTSTDLGSTSL